jgi:hypothetical protein
MMVLVDKKDADRQVVKLEWPAAGRQFPTFRMYLKRASSHRYLLARQEHRHGRGNAQEATADIGKDVRERTKTHGGKILF